MVCAWKKKIYASKLENVCRSMSVFNNPFVCTGKEIKSNSLNKINDLNESNIKKHSVLNQANQGISHQEVPLNNVLDFNEYYNDIKYEYPNVYEPFKNTDSKIDSKIPRSATVPSDATWYET